MKFLIVSAPYETANWLFFIVDEEDLEAELEALGDELAMEDELKEEEGAVPRYLHKLLCPH
jgi:hypothetical protein